LGKAVKNDMKCEDIHEQLLDLAGQPAKAGPTAEQAQHLAACASCTAKLGELRQTMALLDEWHAPEPSPYFGARMRARVREQAQREAEAPQGILGWLRSPGWLRPVAASAFAIMLAFGVYSLTGGPAGGPTTNAPVAVAPQKAPEGSAVADLQTLDKNEDVLANFDLLDDLAASQQPDSEVQ
jgi:anti-sigma factor RsiW